MSPSQRSWALLLVLALAAMTSGAAGEPKSQEKHCQKDEKVNWLTYEEALKLGRDKDRPLVLVFWTRDCRKCEVLKEQGFDRPDTACYVNRSLAPARIEGDKFPELKKKYRVTSYPLVWFLTPEAKEIDYFVGYVPPDRLDLILHYVGDKEYLKKSFEQYEKERDKQ